jgi:hypothetical protein
LLACLPGSADTAPNADKDPSADKEPPAPLLKEEKGIKVDALPAQSSLPANTGADDARLQEQAKQFQIHMDQMIRQSCDDLRQRLQSLYQDHFDRCPDPREADQIALGANFGDLVVQPGISDAQPGIGTHAQPELGRRSTSGRMSSKVLSDDVQSNTSFEENLDRQRSNLLQSAFRKAEMIESGRTQKNSHRVTFGWISIDTSDMSWRLVFLEQVMSVIILLEVCFIGIQMDSDIASVSIIVVDIIFCLMFTIELVLMAAAGLRQTFCGKDAGIAWFNTLLLGFDYAEIVLVFLSEDRKGQFGPGSKKPSVTMLRIVRLFRVVRIMRILRWSVFADLCAMIQGMFLGMPTLGWSMVLFMGPIYVFALLFRESLGRDDHEHVSEMFDSVPRSIYTTFRCAFGDCSSATEGFPLFEYVHLHYGWGWSLVYCMFIYIITIGLFNVISAIFVEATMKSAAEQANRTKQARLRDDDLWSLNVSTLIRRLVRQHSPEPRSLFVCSWEMHMNIPLKQRLEDEHAKVDMLDVEWQERLVVSDKDGKHVDSFSDLSEKFFPIAAKLQPPKAFREIQATSDDGSGIGKANDVTKYGIDETTLTEDFDQISKLAYGGRAIDNWVKDKQVIHSLDELDIDPQDHDRLSDILDPQNDGQVPVLDLVDGIRRLRGFPRRSDIVCIDLMIRQSQRMHHKHDQDLENILHQIQELHMRFDDIAEIVQASSSSP